MAPHLPAVVFPPSTTAIELRKTKPVLFLAIMSVASSETPLTQRRLAQALMDLLANKIIVRGEKSLELVQAILVSVIWYFPPEHFEELKFYQMVHVAGVMAIDIGLGKRKNNSKSLLVPYTWGDHPFRKKPLPDPSTLESRRTWLAVYFLASNVAMALHRPNLIRWQSFTTECMDVLESSPQAAPGDKYLCHLVWTHRIAEEAGVQFYMDDPSLFVNITEPRIQYALRAFERDLNKYCNSIPEKDKQPSLLLSFSVLNLYMHEIALQTNEEHTAASSAEALRDPLPSLGDNVTAAHIGALSACLTSIDGIIETILGLDVFSIRCLPIFNFVRVAYAVVVLIKIYFSASSPNSELGKVIDKNNMKVNEYLDRLFDKFREVAAQDKCRPATKFLLVLGMLRGWFHAQDQPHSQGDDTRPPVSQVPPNFQGSQPAPNASHGPQHQNQPEYKSDNTPLQLLSEIATVNDQVRASQGHVAPPAHGPNPPNYPAWTGPHPQYPFDPSMSLSTSSTGGERTMDGTTQSVNPWIGTPFDGNMGGYLNMGDGLEQAMEITMTGFGQINPADPHNYEHGVPMTFGTDPRYTGPMGFPPSNRNIYG